MAKNINQQTENVKPDPFEVTEEEKKAYAEYVKEMKKTKRERHSQADELLNLTQDFILFHDQYREGFVFLNKESIPLRSKNVRQYLSKKLWEAQHKAASNETLSQVINVLEAKAVFDSPKVLLFNRVGKETNGDESFYYDLGDGKVVKVTDSGWTVCDAPILFRRYSHQYEQVLPIKGGNPFSLFKYLNINYQNRLLILTYLISCFIPDIPHPVFHPHGDHGSGKTTCCRMLKDIVDPSILMTLFLPEDKRELVQIFNHSWMPIFDNVSFFSDAVSDSLSQACTGGGVSKRQLYTDDEDITYSFRRCIGLNGINIAVCKPDLMDRTILIPLERIAENRRKEERQIWEQFKEEKPFILGGIFDVLSMAINIYPNIQLPWTPRMADFGRWGFAIAEGLEKNGGKKFLDSYKENIGRQNEEVIQSNTLAQAILTFMSDKSSWTGTIGDAYCNFRQAANTPDKSDSTFPKCERTLRKYINRIKPNLIDYGISIEIGKHEKGGAPIRIGKFASLGSPSSHLNNSDNLEGEAKVRQNENGEANEKDENFASSKNINDFNNCKASEPSEANNPHLRDGDKDPWEATL